MCIKMKFFVTWMTEPIVMWLRHIPWAWYGFELIWKRTTLMELIYVVICTMFHKGNHVIGYSKIYLWVHLHGTETFSEDIYRSIDGFCYFIHSNGDQWSHMKDQDHIRVYSQLKTECFFLCSPQKVYLGKKWKFQVRLSRCFFSLYVNRSERSDRYNWFLHGKTQTVHLVAVFGSHWRRRLRRC